jgi:hypothetical protein
LPLGFVLLSASPAGARAPDSGIGGRIVAGPICPVESVPPVPGCAPRPLRATLRIRLVYPGTYHVQALAHAGSALPRPPAARRVQVHAGRYTLVTMSYDTRVR